MEFVKYKNEDYNAVCDFLIELNRTNKLHINWNWARFEWMAEHPEFDKSLIGSIGLWRDRERIVGAAIYDMYFGEAFCAALDDHAELYPEILDYAYKTLADENGLAVAICDSNAYEIEAARRAGFFKTEQTETMMSIDLSGELSAELPQGLSFAQLDPVKEPVEFQWLLWQGFDHGCDREVFEKEGEVIYEISKFREHFDPYLSAAAKTENGEYVSCCCLWYSGKTDYAYVEPVCTVPRYRNKGAAKAVIYKALEHAKALGAKKAYVLSDMEFYKRLGFEKEYGFTFYRKKEKK